MEDMVVQAPIHYHLMTSLNDVRKGECCGIKFEAESYGYYCAECDFFFHKRCSNPPYEITHPSSTCGQIDGVKITYGSGSCDESLHIKFFTWGERRCDLCGVNFKVDKLHYGCGNCSSGVHIYCAMYPPQKVIDIPQNHHHKLKLEMVDSCFTCAACGEDGDGYPYKCYECDLTFHLNCGKYEAEVNHPSHSLHPLKLFKGEPPAYTDGKCRLCGEKLVNSEAFYHCSTCNFSLDFHCVTHQPPLYLHDLNTHDHKLTLMPQLISFTCTACGLNGDRSPYVCLQCNFTAHNDCSGFPWVININRHDHRVSRTSLLGVVNSVCGICQQKLDWSCGGYSCLRCPDSLYHTKCATRDDVSDGIEMKDEPEEDEYIEPFWELDENTIQHFSHREHKLRLDKSGIFIEERGSCKACTYPIYHDPFYSCMRCDFILHESCAKLPKRKRHMLSNKPLIMDAFQWGHSKCKACGVRYSGFTYKSDENDLDVRCASISEPFVHQSHPHPLFYTSPQGVCSVCDKGARHVLKCVEDKCGYILDFKCALLPYEVKHRVDNNFLSLCYGEDASGKYWCDICEKETDPKGWFYTSKDSELTLHIDCVLGDFRALEPGRKITAAYFQYVSSVTFCNNSMSRPLCNQCKSRCRFPMILKVIDDDDYDDDCIYYCSMICFDTVYLGRYPYKKSLWFPEELLDL